MQAPQAKSKTEQLNEPQTALIDARNNGVQMNRAMLRSTSILVAVVVTLSACTSTGSFQGLKHRVMGRSTENIIVPELRPEEQKQPQNLGNITIAEAAKVTDSEHQQAVSKPVGQAESDLGTTIASLGLLDNTGFWLETPLVEKEVEGRVVYLKSGASINLKLIPNGGDKGSGSQISVAAMQLLGIPVVDLAELRVFMR